MVGCDVICFRVKLLKNEDATESKDSSARYSMSMRTSWSELMALARAEPWFWVEVESWLHQIDASKQAVSTSRRYIASLTLSKGRSFYVPPLLLLPIPANWRSPHGLVRPLSQILLRSSRPLPLPWLPFLDRRQRSLGKDDGLGNQLAVPYRICCISTCFRSPQTFCP